MRCNRCMPKIVANRACYTLQPTWTFSYNAIATQVVKKIAPCNTASYRAGFYFLQRFQRFLKLLIASPIPRLPRVFQTIASCSPMCSMSPAACSGFLFPTLHDKLQRKLHYVALVLSFLISWPILQSNPNWEIFIFGEGTLTWKVFNYNSFDNI